MIEAVEFEFFRREGYLRVPSVFKRSQTSAILEMIDNDFEHPTGDYVRNDQGVVVRLSDFVGRREEYLNFALSPAFINLASILLGKDVVLLRNRHNHATRNLGSTKPQRFHRDILSWSRSVLTALIYLETSSEQDGATKLIPGSHLMRMHPDANNGGTWIDETEVSMLERQAVSVPAEAGTIVFVDSFAFHAAGQNSGAGNRTVVALGLRSVDELALADPGNEGIVVSGSRRYRGAQL